MCSCGNDVSILLFCGHVLGVVQRQALGDVCSMDQHPFKATPSAGWQRPLTPGDGSHAQLSIPVAIPFFLFPLSSKTDLLQLPGCACVQSSWLQTMEC